MKRLLAILALFTFVMAWPMAAVAGPGADGVEMRAQDQQGIELPDGPPHEDDILQDQHDGQGDPHDLGGGFRGTGSTEGDLMPVPIWIGPFWIMIMQFV